MIRTLENLAKNFYDGICYYAANLLAIPLRPIFTYERNDNPTIKRGDLSTTYRSLSASISERLPPKVFTVSDSVDAVVILADLMLVQGFREVNRMYNLTQEGTYFILEIGGAHIPGVALELVKGSIDVYFFIPRQLHPRFKDAIKYWQDLYQREKCTARRTIGYATAIDLHRENLFKFLYRDEIVTTDSFPSVERLRELGIKRIVYLFESGEALGPIPVQNLGRYSMPKIKPHIKKLLSDYAKHFPLTMFNIDPRYQVHQQLNS